MKIKFYDVDPKYLEHLRQYDSKVPLNNYDKYKKFLCGIVLTVNGHNYYAPVSSTKAANKTSFPIRNESGEHIASIRFSFMIPVAPGSVRLKNFEVHDIKYQNLLKHELHYCNANIEQIEKFAQRTYKIGTNKKHPLSEVCCDFKKLEAACINYTLEKKMEQEQEEEL